MQIYYEYPTPANAFITFFHTVFNTDLKCYLSLSMMGLMMLSINV